MSSNAATIDFPFVAELPKREKSKVGKLWDQLQEMNAIVQEKGMLLQPSLCAELCGVSRQRIYELIEAGRFEMVQFGKHRLITESSVIAYARAERKAGRPLKLPETKAEAVKLACKVAKSSKK